MERFGLWCRPLTLKAQFRHKPRPLASRSGSRATQLPANLLFVPGGLASPYSARRGQTFWKGRAMTDKKQNSRPPAKRQDQKPDKLPPHSVEAEQGVLGCILLSPGDCLPECMAKLPGHLVFYDLRHQTLFLTLVEMFNEKQPVDLRRITLPNRLKNKKQMEGVGGLAYLSTLPDAVPSAANLQCHYRTYRVFGKADSQRKGIEAAVDLETLERDESLDPGIRAKRRAAIIGRIAGIGQGHSGAWMDLVEDGGRHCRQGDLPPLVEIVEGSSVNSPSS